MNIRTSLLTAMAVFLLQAGSAHAALFNYSFTGTVVNNGSSMFGLNTGDIISASGIFDDAVLTGGTGSISFSSASNSMSITVGAIEFTTADPLFGTATLALNASTISSFSIEAQNPMGQYLRSAPVGNAPSTQFFATDQLNVQIDGNWNTGSFSTSPVPVPAALWLFGSGLIGLLGFARRKSR